MARSGAKVTLGGVAVLAALALVVLLGAHQETLAPGDGAAEALLSSEENHPEQQLQKRGIDTVVPELLSLADDEADIPATSKAAATHQHAQHATTALAEDLDWLDRFSSGKLGKLGKGVLELEEEAVEPQRDSAELQLLEQQQDPEAEPAAAMAQETNGARPKATAAPDADANPLPELGDLQQEHATKEENAEYQVGKAMLKDSAAYQTAKLQHELRVVSQDAAVRDQLPHPIQGLKKHFNSNQALDDTKSHPFKEVELRHAGRKYNKLRKKVVDLTHRLAKLNEEASDEAAKEKMLEDEDESKAAAKRLEDSDEDDEELAKFPEDYRNKIAQIQEEMMQKKIAEWKEDKLQRLHQEEHDATDAVEEDRKEISVAKHELKKVLGNEEIAKMGGSPATVLEALPTDAGSVAAVDNVIPRSLPLSETENDQVVTLLSHEVALLERQQEHMMHALSKQLSSKSASQRQ